MTYRQGREERILTLNTLSICLGTFLKDGHTWTLVLVTLIIYFHPKVERVEERDLNFLASRFNSRLS